MPKLKMSDGKIRSIKPPQSGRVDYYDADSGGKLVLRVGPSGVKAWSVIFRVDGGGGISKTGLELRGKQRRLSLGTYPKLSLQDARVRAAEVTAQADQGIDPRGDKLAAANARYDSTVERVADRMLSMEDHKSVEKYRTTFRLHINPEIGKTPIADLTVQDVDALIDQILTKGEKKGTGQRGKGTAREVRKMMRLLMGFAKTKRLVTDNFMADYKHKKIVYKPRARWLNADELKAVWNAAKSMEYPHGPIVQLLILTGLRKSEITKLTWAELDHENRALTLDESRSKTGRPILAPMSAMAWDIITAQPKQDGPFVFSTEEGHTSSVLGSKIQERLHDAVGFNDFTFHDLRRTLRTWLGKLKVPREIAERIINHSQGEDDYDLHEYEDEQREALERFSEHLRGLVDA